MSLDRRVVVTGLGIVSCIGNNIGDYWNFLINGISGIGNITNFDATKYRTHVGGEVKRFNPENYLSFKDIKRFDKFCQFAIAASDDAMKMAGLPMDLSTSFDPSRIGVLVGSGVGGIRSLEKGFYTLYQKGPDKVSPLIIPMFIIDIASGNLSMRYCARGPNMSIATACSSSSHSIGESYWIIKRNDADIMISGGAESSISPISFAGFCAMRAMSTNNDPKKASKPFDANRDGFVMSEGSGIVILEELEHAKKRKANIYAEIVGYGASADAHHITIPDPNGEGIYLAVNTALKHANLSVDDIDGINAHGTSTKLNDKTETLAYKRIFKNHINNINISSIKGTIGHNLGAAGAIESISCIKSIIDGIIPPTINYETKDPECDLNYTPNIAVEKNIDVMLNLNCGFGGHNAAIIFKKFS